MTTLDALRRIIIIPAFNEAGNLPRVIPEIRSRAPGFDLVVIDDGSSDATSSVARSLDVFVIPLPVNLGYGGAVQTGFRYAVRHSYDLAVVVDADGQHDPANIVELAQVVASGQADVAIGSRFRGRADYPIPRVKRLGMRVFAWVVSTVTGRQVTDPTSGFQALNRDVLRFFAYDNYPVDYPDADTLLVLHYAGFRTQEVPVTIRQRLSGVSMHSGWKPFYYIGKMWLAIAMVLLREKTHFKQARVARS